jgi:hypothetical protein
MIPDVKENPATGAKALGVEDLPPPHPATKVQINNMKISRHLSEQDISTPILSSQGNVNHFQIFPSFVIIGQENEKTGCQIMN